MFGLGKPRTRLGKFIDADAELSQELVAKKSGVSRDGISDLCDGRKNIRPGEKTQVKIIGALRRMGYNVNPDDFWP